MYLSCVLKYSWQLIAMKFLRPTALEVFVECICIYEQAQERDWCFFVPFLSHCLVETSLLGVMFCTVWTIILVNMKF